MKKLIMFSIAVLATTTSQSTQADTNITKWQQTRFSQLDTNANGSLNVGELRGTTKAWMSKAGYSEEKQIEVTGKKFVRIDTNKDNQVSLEEYVIDQNNVKQRKKNNK